MLDAGIPNRQVGLGNRAPGVRALARSDDLYRTLLCHFSLRIYQERARLARARTQRTLCATPTLALPCSAPWPPRAPPPAAQRKGCTSTSPDPAGSSPRRATAPRSCRPCRRACPAGRTGRSGTPASQVRYWRTNLIKSVTVGPDALPQGRQRFRWQGSLCACFRVYAFESDRIRSQ